MKIVYINILLGHKSAFFPLNHWTKNKELIHSFLISLVFLISSRNSFGEWGRLSYVGMTWLLNFYLNISQSHLVKEPLSHVISSWRVLWFLLWRLLSPWWGLAVIYWDVGFYNFPRACLACGPGVVGLWKHALPLHWVSTNYTSLVSRPHPTPLLVPWTSLRYGCISFWSLAWLEHPEALRNRLFHLQPGGFLWELCLSFSNMCHHNMQGHMESSESLPENAEATGSQQSCSRLVYLARSVLSTGVSLLTLLPWTLVSSQRY